MKYIAAISTATAIKHKSMAETCENGPGVDSYGDGCEWYDDMPEDCGWYDTATWSSHDACCACRGQPVLAPHAVLICLKCKGSQRHGTYFDQCEG